MIHNDLYGSSITRAILTTSEARAHRRALVTEETGDRGDPDDAITSYIADVGLTHPDDPTLLLWRVRGLHVVDTKVLIDALYRRVIIDGEFNDDPFASSVTRRTSGAVIPWYSRGTFDGATYPSGTVNTVNGLRHPYPLEIVQTTWLVRTRLTFAPNVSTLVNKVNSDILIFNAKSLGAGTMRFDGWHEDFELKGSGTNEWQIVYAFSQRAAGWKRQVEDPADADAVITEDMYGSAAFANAFPVGSGGFGP